MLVAHGDAAGLPAELADHVPPDLRPDQRVLSGRFDAEGLLAVETLEEPLLDVLERELDDVAEEARVRPALAAAAADAARRELRRQHHLRGLVEALLVREDEDRPADQELVAELQHELEKHRANLVPGKVQY